VLALLRATVRFSECRQPRLAPGDLGRDVQLGHFSASSACCASASAFGASASSEANDHGLFCLHSSLIIRP
jgi:hypothetical protein